MRKIDLTNFQVATSETARQINRRIALNFLRRQQPMSRADLARRSGLQRSTVSSIIDQLIGEGWVTEGAMGRGRAVRGRRPRFLHLNVERASIVGVELRPETTTVALADIDARVVMHTSWPTPRTPSAFIRELGRTVAGFRKAHPHMILEGLGVSLPGRLDSSGKLVFAPNLGWGQQIDLRQPLEAAVGVPVMLENAANACALAELWFGGHPEHVRNLIAVTVSEGIGVGLLLNGQLLHGADGLAGEFGHVSIDENGPACSCGRRGCWERYASNAAAIQHYVSAGPAGKGTPPHSDRRHWRSDGRLGPGRPPRPGRRAETRTVAETAAHRADRSSHPASPARRRDARRPAALRRAGRGLTVQVGQRQKTLDDLVSWLYLIRVHND
jgi:ROK family/MarR family